MVRENANTAGIDDLVVTGYGDTLIARYRLPVGPVIDGKQESAGPRLTVFRKRGGVWLVVAHANFAPIPR